MRNEKGPGGGRLKLPKTPISKVSNRVPGATCPPLKIQPYRSEGFPNGIFHPCPLWARALARWKNCRRAAAAAVGVSWNSDPKCPKYKKMHTFSKMGMSEISRNVNLAEIKAPAGAS